MLTTGICSLAVKNDERWINSARGVYSPRLHFVGRPSLLRKEGEERILFFPSFRRRRVVEHSDDRVSKLMKRQTIYIGPSKLKQLRQRAS
jgi:hypothetical protein